MLGLPPAIFILVAIVATALAQILLKRASYFETMTSSWIAYMGLAAAVYVVSFLLYALVLKHYALNKIYPAMTVAQIVLITVYGLLVGEAVNARHAMGLLCGMLSIYLILS